MQRTFHQATASSADNTYCTYLEGEDGVKIQFCTIRTEKSLPVRVCGVSLSLCKYIL